MIIAIASERGSVEKSILAVNLAALGALAGKKVLLMDADPTQSSLIWSRKRTVAGIKPKVPTYAFSNKSIQPELEHLIARYHDIVIDTEGRDCLASRWALVVAHIAVVPIRPHKVAVTSQDMLIRRLETARLFNPRIQVLFVITCAYPDPSAEEFAAVQALVGRITSATLANTTIHEKTPIRRAFAEGLSISEYRPKDDLAIAEMANLYREVAEEKSAKHSFIRGRLRFFHSRNR